MTVRDDPTAQRAGRARDRAGASSTAAPWRSTAASSRDGSTTSSIAASDPRVLGCGLAGTRDLISFLKYDTSPDNPAPGLTYAIGWGVSQSGRFLRHFLYQGFNDDEQGRKVFDGVFDQVGGAGRGSFNHRFGQASRDALQYFNILFPVDLFPFTDGPSTDPETGVVDSLLARAERDGHRAEDLSPADEFRVLQPRRLARPHRSDRHEGRRAAGEHARLHDRVGAARSRAVSAGVERRRRHGRPRGAESAELLAGRPRAVPRARSLGRRGRRAAAERVSEDRRRHADAAGEGWLAGRSGLSSCRSSRCARFI